MSEEALRNALALLQKTAKAANLDSKQLEVLKKSLEDKWRSTKVETILSSLITNDTYTNNLKEKIRLLSQSNLNVLILGETGTGKELIASALHGDRQGSFVAVNCGGIPDTLLETEFFGSSKGGFTNAIDRPGYFELAQNGTIFLDEIGELPYLLQCKLLRVIDNHKIRRVGGINEIEVNCRIISATNSIELNNKKYRKERAFREDLYFRLAGTILMTKPLRERKEDIRLITKYRDKKSIIPEEIITEWMTSHLFEGNVRELINMINEYIELSKIEYKVEQQLISDIKL